MFSFLYIRRLGFVSQPNLIYISQLCDDLFQYFQDTENIENIISCGKISFADAV